METYTSEIYGVIPQPESFEELIQVIQLDNPKGSRNVRYWRGQSNIDWKIDSSGYRRLMNTHLYGDDIDDYLKDYEKNLLEQASHKGYRLQYGRELYDVELLGKLQLHGAATRLVDFSRNLLIGLWFCIQTNELHTGLLLGIHTDFVSGDENRSRKETYDELMKECESKDNVFTWEPPNVSTRTAAQHSQFLYSKFCKEKTGSLVLPKEEYGTLFLAISPKMKKQFKTILESLFDFWTLTLFPDLDGFGAANNYKISRWDMDRW